MKFQGRRTHPGSLASQVKVKMATMGGLLCIGFALLVFSPPAAAVDGTFRGRVIDPPMNQPLMPGWIFVEGNNRMLRRVEVAHAEVVFGDEIPEHQRHKCNSDCLSAGQEVRVTARQDSAGEWRAKRVEILRLATQVAEARCNCLSLLNLTANLSQNRVTSGSESASHPTQEKSNTKVRECAAL
jgi:hypothetical protein